MPRRRNAERPGGRLAKEYLTRRADQWSERQPDEGAELARTTVVLPRLDSVHLNSPEAYAQYRIAQVARLATGGDRWFQLAGVRQ